MQISSPKRLLEHVMPLRIIREVEKWPVIYKKDSPEMINPHFKYKVWEEVAKNLFDNFQSYSTADKQSRVTGLMKKWRNLRDTFKRHLKIEKKNREGHNIKKKEYVYFKHMSFLLPHMAEAGSLDGGGGGGDERAPLGSSGRARRSHRAHERSRRAVQLMDASPLPSISDIEHIDEDRHFLLSLLPSFKRMNDDEKLTAKMEILKVIKDVKNSSMALETFVTDDVLALTDAQLDDDDVGVAVKKELLTVEVSDYKSGSDFGSASGDSE